MTIDYIVERMKYVGKPLSEEQIESVKKLTKKYGSNVILHEPIESKIPYVEASVGEDDCYIIHADGTIDKKFDANDNDSFGMMVWKDDKHCNIIFAYYF